MNKHDTVAYQRRLATYRDNLRYLLACLEQRPQQQVLLLAAEEARRSIAEHKQVLRGRGVAVDDLPQELPAGRSGGFCLTRKNILSLLLNGTVMENIF